MAVEGYAVYADIDNGDAEGTIGSLVGTVAAVNATRGLSWYLAKAGIKLDAPPTSGQGWPR